MQRRQKQPQQQQRSDDVVSTQLCAFAGLRLGETCASFSPRRVASPPLSRVAPPRADAANAMFCAIYVQCAGDGGDVPTRVATGICVPHCVPPALRRSTLRHLFLTSTRALPPTVEKRSAGGMRSRPLCDARARALYSSSSSSFDGGAPQGWSIFCDDERERERVECIYDEEKCERWRWSSGEQSNGGTRWKGSGVARKQHTDARAASQLLTSKRLKRVRPIDSFSATAKNESRSA